MKTGPYLVKCGEAIFSFKTINSLDKWRLEVKASLGEVSPLDFGAEFLGALIDASSLTDEVITGMIKMEELITELASIPVSQRDKKRRFHNRRRR